jgi:hypothetical protein
VSKPLRAPLVTAAAAVAGVLLMAPVTASAFTFEDGSGNSMANFDIEEQVRQFRAKPDLNLSTDQKGLTTPYGSFYLGADRNASPFTSPYGGLSNANRQHYERMFTPGYIQGRGD